MRVRIGGGEGGGDTIDRWLDDVIIMTSWDTSHQFDPISVPSWWHSDPSHLSRGIDLFTPSFPPLCINIDKYIYIYINVFIDICIYRYLCVY